MVSLLKGTNHILRTPSLLTPSKPNYLPTAPFPNTLGTRAFIYEFEEKTIQSLALHHLLFGIFFLSLQLFVTFEKPSTQILTHQKGTDQLMALISDIYTY